MGNAFTTIQLIEPFTHGGRMQFVTELATSSASLLITCSAVCFALIGFYGNSAADTYSI